MFANYRSKTNKSMASSSEGRRGGVGERKGCFNKSNTKCVVMLQPPRNVSVSQFYLALPPMAICWGLERITLDCCVGDYHHYSMSWQQTPKLSWARNVCHERQTLLLWAIALMVSGKEAEVWNDSSRFHLFNGQDKSSQVSSRYSLHPVVTG